jgi:hypothetical protein
MSSARLATITERKALLVTRCELDRVRVTLAVHGIRAIVAPAPSTESLTRAKPMAAMLVGLAGPLLGMPRLARWLRVGTLALAAYRIARSWGR